MPNWCKIGVENGDSVTEKRPPSDCPREVIFVTDISVCVEKTEIDDLQMDTL